MAAAAVQLELAVSAEGAALVLPVQMLGWRRAEALWTRSERGFFRKSIFFRSFFTTVSIVVICLLAQIYDTNDGW